MIEPQKQSKRTVLILDDEPHIVTYLETLLQDNGYETVAASNGKEGMEKTRSTHPDLICLDITMPEQSGIRFYRDLKEDPELAHIPVVVVTAVTGYGGEPESFKQFLASRRQVPPPEGFFSKPIDRDEFLAAVERLLN
jgi:CheY-like chemotaxis protein